MNQRRQPPAPRLCRYYSHVAETTWNRSEHGGGAAGIKGSAEVKETPVRFPRRRARGGEGGDGWDKDPRKWRGRRR